MQKVKKVVIPIAGHGTRMFPATKVVPKALHPIIDPSDGLCKPILLFVLEQILNAYDTEEEKNQVRFCIVLQENQKPLIQTFFSHQEVDKVYAAKEDLNKELQRIVQLSSQITYVVQEKQEGFGHAVLCAKEFVGNEPFLVLLGDHVFHSAGTSVNCVRQVINAYHAYGSSALGTCTCGEADLRLYGILGGSLFKEQKTETMCLKLHKVGEKPTVEYARANLRVQNEEEYNAVVNECKQIYENTKKTVGQLSPSFAEPNWQETKYLKVFGIYCFTPAIFEILKRNYESKVRSHGELQLTDAMQNLIDEYEGLVGVVVKGKTYDTGIPPSYTETMGIFNSIHSVSAAASK